MSADKSQFDPSSHALSNAYSYLDTRAFTKIQDGTYLQGQNLRDVFEFLAHCLTVRAIDLHKRGINMDGTPYQKGLKKANLTFQDFLIKAENVPNLLPAEWDRDACIRYCSGQGWLDSEKEWVSEVVAVEEAWEEDDAIILKLRCLGEVIYGSAVNGEPLVARMAALEVGLSKSGTPLGSNKQPSQAKQTK